MDIKSDFVGLLCQSQGIVLDQEEEEGSSLLLETPERKRPFPDWSRFADHDSPLVSIKSLTSKPAVSEKHPIAVMDLIAPLDEATPEKRKKLEQLPAISVSMQNLKLQHRSDPAAVTRTQVDPAPESVASATESPVAMDQGSADESDGTCGCKFKTAAESESESRAAAAAVVADSDAPANPETVVSVIQSFSPTAAFTALSPAVFSPVQPPRFQFGRERTITFGGRRTAIAFENQAAAAAVTPAPVLSTPVPIPVRVPVSLPPALAAPPAVLPPAPAPAVMPQQPVPATNTIPVLPSPQPVPSTSGLSFPIPEPADLPILTANKSRSRSMGSAGSKSGGSKSILRKSASKRFSRMKSPTPSTFFAPLSAPDPGSPLTPPPEADTEAVHDMTFVAMADLSISDTDSDAPTEPVQCPNCGTMAIPTFESDYEFCSQKCLLEDNARIAAKAQLTYKLPARRPALPLMLKPKSRLGAKPAPRKPVRRLPMLLQLKSRPDSPSDVSNWTSSRAVPTRKKMEEEKRQRMEALQQKAQPKPDQQEEEELDEETRALLREVANKNRDPYVRFSKIKDHVASRVKVCNNNLASTADDLVERMMTIRKKRKQLSVRFIPNINVRLFEKDHKYPMQHGYDGY